ncbi:MAG: CopG family transcriptional regulator [Gemmatimonadota bacterium]
MAREATLHVKLDRETDENLKRLAAAQGKSKGQLVREAIAACYQSSFDALPLAQRQALAAYQGGYISVGSLARAMGIHVLELRGWLADRGIAQRVAYGDHDADSA